MKILAGILAVALGFMLHSPLAHAQSSSGSFGSMSPGSYGNGGGGGSDFQKVREDMVKKMQDGSYADVLRQGQDNVDAFSRLRARESGQR